jgi:uncharacterized protein YjiS (DUF1127 family)
MVALVRALNNDFAIFNGFFASLNEMVEVYKARMAYRQELAGLSFREIQDIGLDQAAVDQEAAKLFWQA